MHTTKIFRKTLPFLILTLIPIHATGAVRQDGTVVRAPQSAPRRAQPEIEMLIEEARTVPPEFGADALIRIAQSKGLAVKRRKALLEEAFTLAYNARYPMRRKALPGSNVDTRPGYASRAFDLELDALSLQCRAVRAMLEIDKQRAREMFRVIPTLKFPRLTCGDALVYEVSTFYETLAAVANSTFSAEEAGRYEHVSFVEEYLNAVTSPVQVGPAASLLMSMKLTAPQFERLVRAFSASLNKVSGDDRSFSYSLGRGATNEIMRLAESSKRQGFLTVELLKAAREFLAKHLHAERCSDTLNERRLSAEVPTTVEHFNKYVSEVDPEGKGLAPLSREETKPSKVEEIAKIHEHWETKSARRLLVGYKALRFGSGQKPLTVNYRRNNSEWESKLSQYLSDLSGWRDDEEETEEDYFHQKSVLYEGLFELVPDAAARVPILTSYVSFLNKPVIQQDKPLDWFLHVSDLLEWARAAEAEERARVFSLLSNSGDPILHLYAELERLLPVKAAGVEKAAPVRPSLKGNVTFRLKGFPYADVVVLAGSFNKWNQSETTFAQVDGEWVCRVQLAPGKYTYKFIVDGEWMLDPANPLKEDDGSSNVNSVLVVEDKPQ